MLRTGKWWCSGLPCGRAYRTAGRTGSGALTDAQLGVWFVHGGAQHGKAQRQLRHHIPRLGCRQELAAVALLQILQLLQGRGWGTRGVGTGQGWQESKVRAHPALQRVDASASLSPLTCCCDASGASLPGEPLREPALELGRDHGCCCGCGGPLALLLLPARLMPVDDDCRFSACRTPVPSMQTGVCEAVVVELQSAATMPSCTHCNRRPRPPPPASPRAAAHHGPPPPRVLLHLAVRHQSGRAADGGLVGELGQRVPGHVVEHRGALRCVRSQVRRRYKAVGCGGAAVVSMGTNALHLAPTLSRAFAAEHRSSSSRLVPSLPPSTHTHLLIVAQRQQLARGAPADRLDTQQVVLVG